MKNLISTLYARKHLGRSLAVTGISLLAISYGISLATGALEQAALPFLAISAITYPVGVLLLPTSAIVGILSLQRNRGSVDGAPDTKGPGPKSWVGRIIAIVALLIMFSPFVPAYLLPEATGTSPGIGNVSYLYLLIITIPIGAGGLIIAAIVGIVAMQKSARN